MKLTAKKLHQMVREEMSKLTEGKSVEGNISVDNAGSEFFDLLKPLGVQSQDKYFVRDIANDKARELSLGDSDKFFMNTRSGDLSIEMKKKFEGGREVLKVHAEKS